MPHPIEPSTLRILRPTGETVGTGFLVSRNLAVTCAHVVANALGKAKIFGIDPGREKYRREYPSPDLV